MDFFFLIISTEVTPQSGDPTSGVYEQPTNTHCFALGCVCGLLMMMEDNIRPTRHKGIMEKYPPFPKRGLISLSSFFVFVFVIFFVIISERMHVVSCDSEMGKNFFHPKRFTHIKSVPGGILINEQMRRIHGYIVAFPFVLAREE